MAEELEALMTAFKQQVDELEEGDELEERQRMCLDIAMEEVNVADEEIQSLTADLDSSRDRVHAERNRYETLFFEAPHAYLITDHEGVVLEANRAASELLGLRAKYLVGKPLFVFVGDDDRNTYDTFLRNAPSASSRREIELALRPRGADELLGTTVSVVESYDASGQPTLQWALDVGTETESREETESRDGKERLKSQRDHALALLREIQGRLHTVHKKETLGRLVESVAHDFGNVLNSIMRFAEYGLGDGPEESSELFDRIRKSVGRGAALTRHLMISAIDEEVDLEDIDLTALLEADSEFLSGMVGDGGRLVLDLPDEHLSVRADRVGLEQILGNLVSNADAALEGSGTITVCLRPRHVAAEEADAHDVQAGDYVELIVQDDGIGMDDDTQAKIFEPYFTTKGDDGSGLGLPTTAAIVKGLRGFIEVDSDLGEGTIFCVSLPSASDVDVSRRGVPEDDDPEPDLANEVGPAILLVADSGNSLETLRTLFEGEDCRVSEARNTRDALGEIDRVSHQIQGVIIDEGLGVEDVDLLVTSIRQRDPKIAAIVLRDSRKGERTDTSNLPDFPSSDVPVTREDAYDVISTLLRQYMTRSAEFAGSM